MKGEQEQNGDGLVLASKQRDKLPTQIDMIAMQQTLHSHFTYNFKLNFTALLTLQNGLLSKGFSISQEDPAPIILVSSFNLASALYVSHRLNAHIYEAQHANISCDLSCCLRKWSKIDRP